jgi:hypothetical protein
MGRVMAAGWHPSKADWPAPGIWNPIHMDENGQNGTYMSEHGTDMSVHVYACS